MKKIIFLSLLILAACSYEPEVKPSPPYGANGYACGTNYQDWTWYEVPIYSAWNGSNAWTGPRTAYLNAYWKPASAGSTFWWPVAFSAVIRVYNQGKCKFRATYGDWSQDVSVGGYADFYYSWTPPPLGCNQSNVIPDTSLPINFSFYRISCGTSAGNPQPGYYVFKPVVDVISMTNGQAFSNYVDPSYTSSTATCTN